MIEDIDLMGLLLFAILEFSGGIGDMSFFNVTHFMSLQKPQEGNLAPWRCVRLMNLMGIHITFPWEHSSPQRMAATLKPLNLRDIREIS